MEYRLQVGDIIYLTVQATEPYSGAVLLTDADAEYRIRCAPDQVWRDSFIRSTPKGFFNALAWLNGLRVKGARCFCLCGVYAEDDRTAFAIGLGKTITAPATRSRLQFFANDTAGYYKNNSGSILLNIQRLR